MTFACLLATTRLKGTTVEIGSAGVPILRAEAPAGEHESPVPALRKAAESDRVGYSVACLNTQSLPCTMVSNAGFYCDVWRSAGRIVGAEAPVDVDFVVKISKRRCTAQEVRLLGRDYRRLRDALGEIVPEAIFVATTHFLRPSGAFWKIFAWRSEGSWE